MEILFKITDVTHEKNVGLVGYATRNIALGSHHNEQTSGVFDHLLVRKWIRNEISLPEAMCSVFSSWSSLNTSQTSDSVTESPIVPIRSRMNGAYGLPARERSNTWSRI